MKHIKLFENYLNEAKTSWGVRVSSPYSNKDEKKAAMKFVINEPITVVGVSGEIDENNTDLTVQYSNADQVNYTYTYDVMEDIKELTIYESGNYPYNGYDVPLEIINTYFGSTGTLVGDICLIYRKYMEDVFG
tara:strand:- start:80805 stop:81203 length:399 start_codon:yes stop_codon:yes gene_type:complete